MATGQISFFSSSLSRFVPVQVILPNDTPPEWTQGNPHFQRPMKTLILLHGFSGYNMDWVYGGLVQDAALKYNLAVLMPSGDNSFYLDQEATGCRYGTFTGEELPDYFGKLFGLSEKREDWLVGGYSMGGFGALHTAFQFPERFGSVFALSSALIVHKIENMDPGAQDLMANYAYYRMVFGDLEKVSESSSNPEELVRRNKREGKAFPDIFLACGTEDFLLQENHDFRDFLQKEEIPFRYAEGPGEHNFAFWNPYMEKALEYLLG
ncbi:MAG: acetylesterase [Blautia sp.]|nr:acetylesterase [Blautia sp.]